MVSYTYDTWGKLISITGSLASTVGEKNPYRYRGYRYGSETGLYYLQSRYYNPEWGRFINADGIIFAGPLLSGNLFTYCVNNPINKFDPTGTNPAGGALIGAEVGTAVSPGAGTVVGAVIGFGIGIFVGWMVVDTAQDISYAKEVERAKAESTPAKGPYTVTTIEAVNATGELLAIKDGVNHVSVIPVNLSEMKGWISSRSTALTNPHKHTKLLQSISIKVK